MTKPLKTMTDAELEESLAEARADEIIVRMKVAALEREKASREAAKGCGGPFGRRCMRLGCPDCGPALSGPLGRLGLLVSGASMMTG